MTCGVNHTCAEIVLRLLAIGLSNGAIIALNAIGVTLVYSVVRLINFAHGDLFALATVLAAFVIEKLGLSPSTPPLALAGGIALAFVLASGAGALLNVAIERAAFRPFRSGPRIAPLIATIGISFILYQVALLARYITNAYIPGEHRSVPGIPELPRFRIPQLLPDVDLVAALGLPLRVQYPLRDALMPLVALALAALVGLFLRSRMGKALQACAQDAEMAELCGIDRTRAIQIIFAIGGAMAGASALAYALYYTHPYTLYGAQSSLTALTAAVLGGIGRPRGAFLAGLMLGVVASFSDYFLQVQWTPVVLLGLLIVLLVVRPTGLGRSEKQTLLDGGSGDATIGRAGGGGRRGHLALAALLVVGALYPLLDAAMGGRGMVLALSILVYVLLALGLNVVLGFAGLLDLGFAACFAIGAYVAGILTMTGSPLAPLGAAQNFVLVFAIAAAVAALFGLLNGLLTMRLRGEYMAIVTLAFGQLAPLLVLNLDTWTGGSRGMAGLPPPQIAGVALSTPTARYYLALGIIALVVLASVWLARSRLGRAWAALSADELAAVSSGVPPARLRCLAFALGAACAGLAGAIFASGFSYVDPTQTEFRLSAMVLAMVVVGGAGSIHGAIIGALLIALCDQVLIAALGAWTAGQAASGMWLLGMLDVRSLNFLVFGLALYLTVLLRSRRSAAA
ncbi:ABC transporter permease [Chloroflexia bacterium SDU3-3]|nr:ABC transporter permease [Chloroflexia bacterium SDU3-3]